MRRRSSRNSSCVQRGQADIAKIKVQYLAVAKKLGHSYGGPRVRISLPPAANPVQTVHSFGLRPLAPSPHSHEWHLATGRRFKSSRGRHFVSLQRLRPGALCDNVEIPSHASEVWSWPISALIRCTTLVSVPHSRAVLRMPLAFRRSSMYSALS